MNNMIENKIAGIQALSFEEIDEVSGGLAPSMVFAIRVGAMMAAGGVVGVGIGFAAGAAIYYLNQP
jgi:lactobin A/cerein 7B family class IIb bacteriocin